MARLLLRRNRLLPIILAGIALAVLTGQATGELIPTPEFTGHPIPTTSVPNASPTLWSYIDVVLLLVALCLATYFALGTRSRRNLFLLSAVALFWFGFWRGGCVCAIGATQNVAQGICDPGYVVPVTVVAFFTLPLVFTLFFGRTFCASVCPLGAVQELMAVRSAKVPRWLDQSLGLVPYIYLGAAVLFAGTGTAYLICRYDPFVAFFRRSGSANMLVFGASMLLIGLVVGRPYCRYLCPYGAILGVLSKVSKWHLRIPPEECINCRLCEDVCPYGAILPPTVQEPVAERISGRHRLAILLVSVPVLIASFAWLGSLLSVPLSRLDPQVRLAEQVRAEELETAEATTDASDAFRNSGRTTAELYQAAVLQREHFGTLGGWLGAWVGLVFGAKLIHLSVRRRRTDYHPDRSGCVSCGRCFKYCPVEQVRLGLIQDVSEVVEGA